MPVPNPIDILLELPIRRGSCCGRQPRRPNGSCKHLPCLVHRNHLRCSRVCQSLRHPSNAFNDRPPHRTFINQFFSIRQPGITVSANVAQLLAFPAGKLLEAVLTSRRFTTFGYTWSLNPGKFNLKEHMVVTIMANVGLSLPIVPFVGVFAILPVHSRS